MSEPAVRVTILVTAELTAAQHKAYGEHFGTSFPGLEIANRLRPAVERALFDAAGTAGFAWLGWLIDNATVTITRETGALGSATVVTEWGVDCTDGRGEHRVNFGDSKYGSEDTARAMIDRDLRGGIGEHDVLMRRTITYGPWEVVPGQERGEGEGP